MYMSCYFSDGDPEILDVIGRTELEEKIQKGVIRRLQQTVYRWKPIESVLFVITRLILEQITYLLSIGRLFLL